MHGEIRCNRKAPELFHKVALCSLCFNSALSVRTSRSCIIILFVYHIALNTVVSHRVREVTQSSRRNFVELKSS